MHSFRRVLFFVLLALVLGAPAIAMTSTNYQINWDDITGGGDDFGTSTNYQINDTIGDTAAGSGSSANYTLHAGYRYPESSNTVGFTVRAAASTPVPAWTAFNNVDQVTVSSASGFVLGDLIAVVENRGLSQKVAVGRIVSIVGLVITVDAFDGEEATISAIPAGGDDVVYRLSTNALNLGTISATTPGVGVVGVSVFSTAPNGYALYLHENTDLQNGANNIDDVADSAVTNGSEEYGYSVKGSGVTIANDNAVTGILANYGTDASTPAGITDKYGLSFKAGASSTTVNAAYTHTTYYTVTAQY